MVAELKMMTMLQVAEVREELKDSKAAERLRSSAEKQVRLIMIR